MSRNDLLSQTAGHRVVRAILRAGMCDGASVQSVVSDRDDQERRARAAAAMEAYLAHQDRLAAPSSSPPPPAPTHADATVRVDLERRLSGWWPKSWVVRILLASVLVGAGVAVGTGLVNHFGKDERSTSWVESEIRSWVDKSTQGGGVITVRCPDPIEWRVGEDFHCIARQGGQSLGVTVTMENDDGDVTWRAE